jgi:UDP-N-acetylmuramoyl-tripeptide--D-alanyl-D-alanine ligase
MEANLNLNLSPSPSPSPNLNAGNELMHASLTELVAAIDGARLIVDAVPAGSPDSGGDAIVTGLSTDSRNVPPGALFVALRGDTFDGHDFLAQVAQAGTAVGAAAGAGAIVAEELPAHWSASSNRVPVILVPDTLVALGRIANAWRSKFALPVIGVTGSNGKTTVKEMIAAILHAAHAEHGFLATRGNFNNEIGVPLTLLRLQKTHAAAVIELGMNHPGEIARLSAIAEPTLALVNNAQREHQEFMHSVHAVALENGTVLAGLPVDGVAVFPFDDEFTALWRTLAGARRVITFAPWNEQGKSTAETVERKDAARADVSCTWRANDFGNDLFITIATDADAAALQFFVVLGAAGLHNVRNALAAVACAHGIGIDVGAIKRGLEAFVPVSGRLQRKRAANGVIVIDDSYNANPDSVRAAIDVLAQAEAPRVLVLGDMGEVGTQGREYHEEIGAYAASKGIEHVLATGDLARHLSGGHGTGKVEHFEQFDDLLVALDALLVLLVPAGLPATVLVKGSRFMKMERVVRHLTAPQEQQPADDSKDSQDSQSSQKNNKEVH